MAKKNEQRTQVTAMAVTVFFIGLLWLYVREFPVFSNTLGVKRLVLGAMAAGLAVAAAGLYCFRARFQPWNRHLTEMALIAVLSVFFAPLFGSRINRAFGRDIEQSFEFVAERPYLSSGYGILKGEILKPSGYYLDVKANGRLYRLQYKTQAYFPLTRPGERVLLPFKKGLFGFKVGQLR